MPERVQTACEQCGQVDDHPKVHIGAGRTVHHDCLSVAERAMVIGSSDTAAAVVEACEGGLRGDQLLEHIESLHNEEG
jgi:hypothetical protein